MWRIFFIVFVLLLGEAGAPVKAAEVTGIYERVEIDPSYVCPGRSAPAKIKVQHTQKGMFRATGFALWIQDTPEPAPHTGEFDFPGQLIGNTLRLRNNSSYPIDLQLIFNGDRLVVDAGNTGGQNVTFTGVYKKRRGPLLNFDQSDGITCR